MKKKKKKKKIACKVSFNVSFPAVLNDRAQNKVFQFQFRLGLSICVVSTAQEMKFPIEDLFSKFDQIHRKHWT